ncbi:MAG: endonuclease III [Succiniclasticum sp.]|uniref:DNA-(Apurinic or apyrimidinic site) lyase /endonuclease III n=1 Tax=Aristaeella lactis TaxID=3046383 RepID=A0AC61PHP6_9FIRM|nr:endonuclease III [Aristaeella lactis]MEE3455274.1 endonuclease III [Succiniclasticum sp.]QUA53538.1 endonuclease III [Aristaeella lactis]SMC36578.1 DNA-(apurinic or apyrimidinic site) lyase /endonuclease III [Aristaeella lactis]
MKKEQKFAILAKLEEMYPEAKAELVFSNPYEMLVATMLSAQCTDKQVNKVTPAVFERWPDANSMAEASVEELFPMVKSCGFRSKAGNIIAACRIIKEKHGGQVPDTMEELTALPGVGRKTANVVLFNAFGIPAFAVDTHVFRVSNRMGLCKADTVEETERQMTRLIPREKWGQAHHWLIWHGRKLCKAQRPLCEECGVKGLCSYAAKSMKNEK